LALQSSSKNDYRSRKIFHRLVAVRHMKMVMTLYG
jgi:hypothetical protein